MGRPASSKSTLIAGLMLLFFCVTCPPSMGHDGRPIYVEISEGHAGDFSIQWRIPPVLSDTLLPRISITNSNCTSLGNHDVQPTLAGKQHYICTSQNDANTAQPMVLALNYPASNPVLSTLVSYQWANGESGSFLAGPQQRQIALPRQQSVQQVIVGYTRMGVEHILSGVDHLLFVTCLLLITLRSYRSLSRRLLRRAFWVVTGFTAGHSVTLAWITLGQLSPPSRVVESLIALSILLLVLEIARANTDSISFQKPILISLAFGLLHGLGFAGALQEIGLPYQQEITALAFFNLGVELGQLLYVAVFCTACYLVWLFLHQQSHVQIRKLYSCCNFIFTRLAGGFSCYWLAARLLDL